MNTLLEIKNVTKYFGNGDTVSKALNGVSFTMEQSEFTAVMGASGSGKSTLKFILTPVSHYAIFSQLIIGKRMMKL